MIWLWVCLVASFLCAIENSVISVLENFIPHQGDKHDTTKEKSEVQPQPAQQGLPSYASIVEKSASAVVEIHTTSTLNPYGNDPFFDFFFRSFGEQTTQQQASGSGVIVDASGLIATCAHVVRQAEDIRVRLSDGRIVKAHIATIDDREDLALLQLDDAPQNLPFLNIGSAEDLKVGDTLLAIGNAFGLGIAVTQGIVSAALRVVDERVVLQTDASINPGNSGGALVDANARLVAIPNAILSRSGASHGVGFGRPATIIRALLEEYRNKGQRPWFGVKGKPLSADQLQSLSGEKPKSGWAVTSVHAQSSLAQAGLQQKDIIIEWNGRPITSSAMLRYWERTSKLGDPIKLDVWRAGNRLTIASAVSAAPTTQTARYTVESGPLTGFEVADVATLTGAESENVAATQGVVITKVEHNMMGLMQGLAVGDVIVAWNDIAINSLKDFQTALKTNPNQIRAVIQRGPHQKIVLQMG